MWRKQMARNPAINSEIRAEGEINIVCLKFFRCLPDAMIARGHRKRVNSRVVTLYTIVVTFQSRYFAKICVSIYKYHMRYEYNNV